MAAITASFLGMKALSEKAARGPVPSEELAERFDLTTSAQTHFLKIPEEFDRLASDSTADADENLQSN